MATVFLSKRKGALLLRLTNPIADRGLTGLRVHGRLSYETLEGERVEDQMEAVYYGQTTDERGMFFEQTSVGKTVALAVLVDNMRFAAELYGRNQDAAVDHMQAVVERIQADVDALDDLSLLVEETLALELLGLMEAHAPQGDLYGQR